jgi:hypothetical protein
MVHYVGSEVLTAEVMKGTTGSACYLLSRRFLARLILSP